MCSIARNPMSVSQVIQCPDFRHSGRLSIPDSFIKSRNQMLLLIGHVMATIPRVATKCLRHGDYQMYQGR